MFWFLCFRDGGYVPCARGERKHLQCHPRLSGHCQRNKLLLQIANFTSWQRKSVCIPHLFYCLYWLVNFHFDVICGLSLNRRTPKWILFVKRAFLSLWMLQLSYFSIMGKSWNNYRGKQIRGTFVTIKKPNPKEICVTFVTSLEWRCCLREAFVTFEPFHEVWAPGNTRSSPLSVWTLWIFLTTKYVSSQKKSRCESGKYLARTCIFLSKSSNLQAALRSLTFKLGFFLLQDEVDSLTNRKTLCS